MSIHPQQFDNTGKFRDGTSQRNRSLRAQSPDHISIDERTLADWIKFAQTFAKELTYFNEHNQPDGDWSNFFAGDAKESDIQAIASAIESLNSDRPLPTDLPADTLNRLSQPHFALFVTFLKLLQYPQQQFNDLTQRRLDFYYQQVLRLTKKPAAPDHVHVTFSLAENQTDYLLEKGTRLNAGTDSQGQDLHYAVDTDLYITQAEVASIRVLSVDQVDIDLEAIHREADRSPLAFETMLHWALGTPKQGNSLPPLVTNGNEKPITISELDLMFMRLKEEKQRSGNENLDLSSIEGLDNEEFNQDYILKSLCFVSLEDFYTCFDIYQRGSLGWRPKEQEWQQVYEILERAWRKKTHRRDRLVIRTDKRSVYARSIAEAKSNQPLTLERFQPFNAKTTVEESANNSRKAQGLGIAIASPVLHLQEGERVIRLTLVCQAGTLAEFNASEVPLALQVSTAQGWLSISDEQIKITTKYKYAPNTPSQAGSSGQPEESVSDVLELEITLDANQPAITAPSQDDGICIQTSHPVVRITLKEDSGTANRKPPYQLFQNLCLDAVNIQVSVTGLTDLQLRNDRGSINPKSTFEPFGSQPAVGASFYFAHPEIVSKKLDSLSLKLDWMGLPGSFVTHYHAYFGSGVLLSKIEDNSFKAQLELFINRSWHAVDEQPLFKARTTGTGANAKTELLSSQTLQYNTADFAAIRDTAFTWLPNEATKDDLLDQDCYFRLELTNLDFQHNLYPLVLNKVARATDDATKNLTVYPPYTPKVKAIAIDYQASAEISLKPNADSSSTGQIFQLHPFGYVELQPISTTGKEPNPPYFFLPQYDEEGSLYIGLRKLHPPQWLTLLFQLVSGSGKADLANPEIQWSYLTEKGWQAFQADQVLSDSTNGLLDSGILRFSIPEDATNQNPLMPPGLYWLQASVKENAAAIPDVLDIRTQAVKATFIDQGNEPDRLSQPLAARSIQSLVERRSEIARVEQPYSSFGGRRQETQPAFYTRVSERLRHKQRAIARWDYERLVLEQFPQIYKVKCLTQAEQNLAPGAAQVTLVVIPNLTNTAPFLPLEPKVPQYLLREIEAYLQAHTSPFVKVVVKNPHYERIKYRVEVKFNQGAEQGYYLKKLNEELVRFLSPWAYEEESDISFGSSIHNSTVVHFLETRSYVDYVANLKLFERVPKSDENQPRYQEVLGGLAQVKQVDSILVSEPDHIIGPITTIDYQEEAFEGIGYMVIDTDFVVA